MLKTLSCLVFAATRFRSSSFTLLNRKSGEKIRFLLFSSTWSANSRGKQYKKPAPISSLLSGNVVDSIFQTSRLNFSNSYLQEECNRDLFGFFRRNLHDSGCFTSERMSTTNNRTSAKDESSPKKSKMTKTIGTHNGTFHCDEALACFLLQLLPEYKDSTIVRTRDSSKLDECDIVVDVGGVFDEKKFRFDHHQRTFNESMNSLNPDYKWVTKLSSAGLVYYHFGLRIIEQILQLEPKDPAIVDTIYRKVYENYIEEIDGIDNGINQTVEDPKYRISTNISSRISHLNPRWNQTDFDEEELFKKAMNLVGNDLVDRVLFYKESWIPARVNVLKSLEERKTMDDSGEILVFSLGHCPWKDHLLTIEEEKGITPNIKYVLYADQSGNWRVQCVPVHSQGFTNRLSLPDEWRGLRDNELSEKSGIKGCIFVHASGFIGGNKTYEGALEMARVALKNKKEA